MDDGAGTLTFTRTSPDTLSVFNGSTNLDSQTSFTLTNGQFATISQAAAGIWEVRISGGASGGGLTVNGSGSATNLSSSSPALPTSGAPGSQLVQFQGSGANASGYVNGFWPRPSFIGLREHASKCAYDGNDSNLNCAPQTESPSPSGTPGRNAPVAGSPESVTYTTAGTANSVAGYIGTYQTRTGTNLLFITGSSLGSTTSIRFQAGLTDSNSGTFTQTDALGSTNTAFFRYSTAASDTNFQCITANGSTQTVTNSGIAADTALHHFVILANDSVPNYVFYIDGTAVCTVTATLPAASKNMAVTKFVTSIAASAVNFTDNGFYIESDH
jgi:hypothetical protein